MNTKILCLTAILLLTLYSCRKTTTPPSPAGNGTWSATVNGQQKSGSGRFVYQRSDNDLVLTLVPSATTEYPDITLSVGLFDTATVTAGIYAINSFVAQATYYADSTGNFIYVGSSGQLNVSQFSISGQTVSGTFYFNSYMGYPATDSVIVTNGKFSGPLSIL